MYMSSLYVAKLVYILDYSTKSANIGVCVIKLADIRRITKSAYTWVCITKSAYIWDSIRSQLIYGIVLQCQLIRAVHIFLPGEIYHYRGTFTTLRPTYRK